MFTDIWHLIMFIISCVAIFLGIIAICCAIITAIKVHQIWKKHRPKYFSMYDTNKEISKRQYKKELWKKTKVQTGNV